MGKVWGGGSIQCWEENMLEVGPESLDIPFNFFQLY